MSRPLTRPPSAQRRPPVAQSGTSSKPNLEELHALPDFVDEGENINLDPSLAHDGGVGSGEGTTVIIQNARFGKFQYTDKEGNAIGDYPPEVALFVTLQRKDSELAAREERLSYGKWGVFAPTKDGNFVRPRPQVMAKRTMPPQPYRLSQAVIFLQSLKDAGFSVDRMNKEGAAALNGLVIHVRRAKVSGQGPSAKPALQVDYIEGADAGTQAGTTKSAQSSGSGGSGNPAGSGGASSGASRSRGSSRSGGVQAASGAQASGQAAAHASVGGTQAGTAAVAQSPVTQSPAIAQGVQEPDSNIYAFAEEAMLDILGTAENDTISRAQIPTTLIRIEKWAKHPNRGGILRLLREDSFINNNNGLWTVDGNSITAV